jgi:hypothetical protein
MESSFLTDCARRLAYQGPTLLACLVGFVICFAFWKRAPGAALLASLAVGVLLGTTLGMAAVEVWAGRQLVDPDLDSRHVAVGVLGWLGLVRSSLAAVAYVMLFLAVFTGRRAARPVPPPSPRDLT